MRGDKDEERENREQLRNETKDHLKAIETAKEDKDDPAYIERTASLFKQIAKAMENYLAALYKDAQEILGPPPCDYTVIGLGSMALRQMTPYSDVYYLIYLAISISRLLPLIERQDYISDRVYISCGLSLIKLESRPRTSVFISDKFHFLQIS